MRLFMYYQRNLIANVFPVTISILLIAGCSSTSVKNSAVMDQSTDLMEVIKRDIEQREYHAGKNSKGLQAPNRAHNLRTYFGKDGITIEDRTAEGSPVLVKMSLSEVGRKDNLKKVVKKSSVITTKDNRIEIAHNGITEWYVNTAKGLEQGITVNEKPEGKGNLIVGIKVEGAEGLLKGDKILLKTAVGRELEYGKLKVTDGNGTEIPSEMGVTGKGTIQIAVNDLGAAYPIIIDPIITGEPDAIVESDQANAHLGNSVSGAGDINNDGYADVIVGAYLYDNGQTDEGAAFVYYGSSSGIGTTPDMLESDQASAYFGISVSGAGDIDNDGYNDVIVGAWLYTNGQSQEGAAYVYYGSSSGIGTTPDILESDQANANLGYEVSGAGDIDNDGYDDVIAGAPFYTNGQTGEGAAFVYYGSSSGVGTTPDVLESNQASALLGTDVSGAGDIDNDGYADVIVGADYYDNGQTDEGAAFVYYGSSSGISTTPDILESNQAETYLGISVSGAGDIDNDGYDDVIVGSIWYDNGQADEGAAFVYYGSSSGIGTTPDILESNQASALFGRSVSGAGDTNDDGYADVIIGAPLYDNGQTDEGAAFVYYGSSSGIGTTPDMLESDQASASFGISVSGAGDTNDDGYGDVIVGAHYYDNGQTDEGAFFVYLGGMAIESLVPDVASPQLPGTTITWTATVIGGESPYNYKFETWSVTTLLHTEQDGSSNVLSWTPTQAEDYYIRVTVTDDGAHQIVGDWTDPYGIHTPITNIALSSDLSSPQLPGTTITWTATVTGGDSPFNYKFETWSATTHIKTEQNGSSNVFSWTPTQAEDYNIRVTVTDDGGQVSVGDWTDPYGIHTPIVINSLQPDLSSPQAVNTTIVWTATVSGGDGTLSYKFQSWSNATGTVTKPQPWSSNTWNWTPSVADTHYVRVIVSDEYGQEENSGWSAPYVINP